MHIIRKSVNFIYGRYANELEEYKSKKQQGLEGGATAVNAGAAVTAGSTITTTTTQPEEEYLSSSLNSSVQIQEDEDDEVSFKNNHGK